MWLAYVILLIRRGSGSWGSTCNCSCVVRYNIGRNRSSQRETCSYVSSYTCMPICEHHIRTKRKKYLKNVFVYDHIRSVYDNRAKSYVSNSMIICEHEKYSHMSIWHVRIWSYVCNVHMWAPEHSYVNYLYDCSYVNYLYDWSYVSTHIWFIWMLICELLWLLICELSIWLIICDYSYVNYLWLLICGQIFFWVKF